MSVLVCIIIGHVLLGITNSSAVRCKVTEEGEFVFSHPGGKLDDIPCPSTRTGCSTVGELAKDSCILCCQMKWGKQNAYEKNDKDKECPTGMYNSTVHNDCIDCPEIETDCLQEAKQDFQQCQKSCLSDTIKTNKKCATKMYYSNSVFKGCINCPEKDSGCRQEAIEDIQQCRKSCLPYKANANKECPTENYTSKTKGCVSCPKKDIGCLQEAKEDIQECQKSCLPYEAKANKECPAGNYTSKTKGCVSCPKKDSGCFQEGKEDIQECQKSCLPNKNNRKESKASMPPWLVIVGIVIISLITLVTVIFCVIRRRKKRASTRRTYLYVQETCQTIVTQNDKHSKTEIFQKVTTV